MVEWGEVVLGELKERKEEGGGRRKEEEGEGDNGVCVSICTH